MASRLSQSLSIGVLFFVGVALIGWPLTGLVAVAVEQLAEGDLSGLSSWQPILSTIVVGAGSAVLGVGFGALAAAVTERTSIPGRRSLRVGILLPILVPPFVSALSWASAYGPGGLTDDLLGVTMPGLFGPIGVVLVVAVNAMPLAYVLTAASLRSRGRRELELAARASGGRPGVVTRTITLPLLTPALVGSSALVFVVGINAFGVPAVLGTPVGFDPVTTRIYQEFALSASPDSFGRAIVLATGLVAMAFVFAVIAESALSHGVRARELTAAPSGPEDDLTPGAAWMTWAAWAFLVAVVLFPLLVLVLVSITRGVGLPPTPANWTLGNFGEALQPRLLGALGRSVGLAVAAATIAVALGGAIAAIRHRRSARVAGVAVLLGFAIPGSTMAVAMILGYGAILRDTVWLILIAYVAKLWAVGHRSIEGSVANIAPDVLRAARISGADRVTTLRTVVLPLLRPAAIGAWFLVFVIAFHELTMSSLLYGPGTDTLAVAILNLQQLGDVPVSSALAVILTVPPLVVGLPLLGVFSRLRRSRTP